MTQEAKIANKQPQLTLKVIKLEDHIPDKKEYHNGGKVILPNQFLLVYTLYLDQVGKEMPAVILFKLTTEQGATTHCGTLDFTAHEGCICLPKWMREQLKVNLLDKVTVSVVWLPKAKTVCFRPGQKAFMQLDQKVLLERHLRAFSTLTVGDVIPVVFADKEYSLEVVRADPSKAVDVTECNVEIDYLPAADEDEQAASSPTVAVGHTIFGDKSIIVPQSEVLSDQRGQPDLEWQPGKLFFMRPALEEDNQEVEQNKEEVVAQEDEDGLDRLSFFSDISDMKEDDSDTVIENLHDSIGRSSGNLEENTDGDQNVTDANPVQGQNEQKIETEQKMEISNGQENKNVTKFPGEGRTMFS